MAKFKPLHEFQKPLIGFTPEAFLDYVETAKRWGSNLSRLSENVANK